MDACFFLFFFSLFKLLCGRSTNILRNRGLIFGSNSYRQLSTTSADDFFSSDENTQIDALPGSSEIENVFFGAGNSFFLNENGEVFVMGIVEYSGLGMSGVSKLDNPQKIPFSFNVTSVFASSRFTIVCSLNFSECAGFGDNSDCTFAGCGYDEDIYSPISIDTNHTELKDKNPYDVLVGSRNTIFFYKNQTEGSEETTTILLGTGKNSYRTISPEDVGGIGWIEVFNISSNEIQFSAFLYYSGFYLVLDDGRWLFRGRVSYSSCSDHFGGTYVLEMTELPSTCSSGGVANELIGQKNVTALSCTEKMCIAISDSQEIYTWGGSSSTVDCLGRSVAATDEIYVAKPVNMDVMVNQTNLWFINFQPVRDFTFFFYWDSNINQKRAFGFGGNDEYGFQAPITLLETSMQEIFRSYSFTKYASFSKGLFSLTSTMILDSSLCWGTFSNNESNLCQNGYCSDTDQCSCDEGLYTGTYCDVPICFTFAGTDEAVCSSNGQCVSPDKCVCTFSKGVFQNCTIPSCVSNEKGDIVSGDSPDVCSSHGYCTQDGICSCDDGFNGVACEQKNFDAGLFASITAPIFMLVGVIILVFLCLFFLCILAIIGVLVILVSFLYRSSKKLSKFKSLRNVDLLLEEQNLVEKGQIVDVTIDKDIFNLDINDIHLMSLIGAGGSYSKVYKANYQGEIYAFKSFDTTTVLNSQNVFEEFQREVSILGSFRHPNILQFFGACIQAPRIGILMEFCPKGDLKKFLEKYKKEHDGLSYPTSEKLRILKEIVSAMILLHSKDVIHRDLKPENVLISDNEISKLMDFGLSRSLEDQNRSLTKGVGTNLYMSPELIRGEKYDESIDVYAFGILCWVVLTEIFNCYGENIDGLEYKVANNAFFRPNLHDITGVPWMKRLIRSCWHHKASSRPSFEFIFKVLERKEEDCISIFFVFTDSLKNVKEENAEDFLLKEKSFEEIESILTQSSSSSSTDYKKTRVFVKKGKRFIRLRNDDDVRKHVEEECLIVFHMKENEKEMNLQLSINNESLVKRLKVLNVFVSSKQKERDELLIQKKRNEEMEKEIARLEKENQELLDSQTISN